MGKAPKTDNGFGSYTQKSCKRKKKRKKKIDVTKLNM